jgi:hypothetical protein
VIGQILDGNHIAPKHHIRNPANAGISGCEAGMLMLRLYRLPTAQATLVHGGFDIFARGCEDLGFDDILVEGPGDDTVQ